LIGLLAQTKRRIGNSNRGRLDITADILEASYSGVRKTYLMYRCNMSFKQLKNYLDFLLGKELLCVVAGDVNSNHGLFEITDKGKEFLRTYKGLKALVK
jgi:predicted transcriptional regulator